MENIEKCEMNDKWIDDGTGLGRVYGGANLIKDSGERTQFSSGAVRDMHEGKGRFDLLPMCVLLRLAKHYEAGCSKYGDRNWEKGIPCHSFADMLHPPRWYIFGQ